jgi:hypothetical protein
MMDAPAHRLSLKRRCMGPRAVSIATLLRRADAAMESVVRDFPAYAGSRLDAVRRLADEALAASHDGEKWTALRTALRDLQTSSGMAGASWIARYAGMLLGELTRRETTDRHLPQLVALHLDAMRIAAAGGAGEAALAELDAKLTRAALRLQH